MNYKELLNKTNKLLCRRLANHGCTDSFINRNRNQLFVKIIYKEKNICKENHFYEK